ncbi:MAG: D-glycero-beta-D-manno-heptose 1-phosphate adenylyltransferase [candidate division Zixibacteria bacterium]|nr:D-glycero-beta-D-manno-heptose 1-phosphate adenylyltransferase [candidate division Zixibacteria bacterium]
MLVARRDAEALGRRLRRRKQKIVFTNGVFDVLHRGHVSYLAKARSYGDLLVVGLNSDRSVRRLKGPERPLQSQRDRAEILLALKAVDYVVIFGEQTPARLIAQINPDVLVKGADYRIDQIVGAEFVQAHGGVVRRVRLTPGRSSSKLIAKLG